MTATASASGRFAILRVKGRTEAEVGARKKVGDQPPCIGLCTKRRDAAPNRNGAGNRANRQQCGAIASAGCMAREARLPVAIRTRMGLYGRDARPEKRNSGPCSDGSRDGSRDRIGQCATLAAAARRRWRRPRPISCWLRNWTITEIPAGKAPAARRIFAARSERTITPRALSMSCPGELNHEVAGSGRGSPR